MVNLGGFFISFQHSFSPSAFFELPSYIGSTVLIVHLYPRRTNTFISNSTREENPCPGDPNPAFPSPAMLLCVQEVVTHFM